MAPVASPWPEAIDSLGEREIGPLTSCRCGRATWVRYGGVPQCLVCAQEAAA